MTKVTWGWPLTPNCWLLVQATSTPYPAKLRCLPKAYGSIKAYANDGGIGTEKVLWKQRKKRREL